MSVAVLVLAAGGVVAWRLAATPEATRPAVTHPTSQLGFGGGLGNRLQGAPRWRGEQLLAVAASGPSDVWAVGHGMSRNHHGHGVSLVEHWNGVAWTPVSCPDVGDLRGVTAPTTGQMWAFGPHGIVHADSAGCTRLPTLVIPRGGLVSAISADAANDVWVVGVRSGVRYAPDTIGWNTLVARWNGSHWRVFRTPDLTIADNDLSSVLALSQANVWAAGFYQTALGRAQPLVLHWNGATWSPVHTILPGRGDRVIWTLGSDHTSRPWAAGNYTPAAQGTRVIGIMLRWTGHTWQRVAPPAGGAFHGGGGEALSGATPKDVWAVTADSYPSAAALHFNGHRWSIVSFDWPLGAPQPMLADIVTINQTDVWAVGEWSPWCGPTQALTEHWNGHTWQRIPTAGQPTHINTTAPKPKNRCPGAPRPTFGGL